MEGMPTRLYAPSFPWSVGNKNGSSRETIGSKINGLMIAFILSYSHLAARRLVNAAHAI